MSHLPPDPSPEAAAVVSWQSNGLVFGTGEMPDRVRAHDWSTTVLGSIDSWSATLITTVNTVLGAPIPSGLFWGSELRMIYNDAYRDLLGRKHPIALGERVDLVWWEAWSVIGPQVQTVMDGKGTVVQKDVLIPVSRQGSVEDAYWNYNLSPVYEMDGSIIAVLVTCQEVTQAVFSERFLRASEARILESIGDAVIVTDAAGRITRMNPVAEALTGWKQDEARGFSLEDVFRIINEATRTPVESPAARVIRLGTIVGLANHTILLGKDGAEIHIDDSGAPIREDPVAGPGRPRARYPQFPSRVGRPQPRPHGGQLQHRRAARRGNVRHRPAARRGGRRLRRPSSPSLRRSIPRTGARSRACSSPNSNRWKPNAPLRGTSGEILEGA